ncbi:helix-turn-helix domain-containing protein [Microbacterium sp. MC2]
MTAGLGLRTGPRSISLDALCQALECQPGDLLRWEPGV